MSTAVNGEADASTGLLDSDAFLKPFVDILEDSSSRRNLSTVRSLVLKILAHPQIFTGFDEFKSRCQIEDGSIRNTLDLFSFGTLKDYYANQSDNKDYYLPLNDTALVKLSQLTVVTCIQEACLQGETSISYDALAESLGSMQDESIRDTEDVLIKCVYSNILKGELCQKTKSFGWTGERLPVVLSRDVAPSSLSGLLEALEGLGQRLEESQTSVSHAQEQVTENLQTTAEYWTNSLQNQKKFMDEKGSSRLLTRQVPGSSSASLNPRRSSKRSRGGMAGSSFPADASGYRM
mmetsp:Transcript_17557/g.36194  ORF Transcript_17557/g.36194 Transcript_17557/m.36194 type:complete len:292 (+) Transcript_17557:147-1022(+)